MRETRKMEMMIALWKMKSGGRQSTYKKCFPVIPGEKKSGRRHESFLLSFPAMEISIYKGKRRA
jgi:hypothetical protein